MERAAPHEHEEHATASDPDVASASEATYTAEALIRRLRQAISLAALRQSAASTRKASVSDVAVATLMTNALDVLEQLTTDSRVEAPLQVVNVELADVLMQLLAAWKSEAPRHSLELALPGDNPSVLADEQTVIEVTRLLLAAAIGLAPGGGTVRVSLRTQDGGALIGVRQHETQLPEAHLCEVFEPFPALPELDVERQAALFPLVIARRMVESHGGRAWAEAAPQTAGMALLVWWPQTPTLRLERNSTPEQTFASPARLPLERRDPVVAILEADSRMARYLRANISAHGFRASTVASVDEAFKCIDRDEPDLLLVDGGLLASDDANLLARLRQYASAPILVLGRSDDPRVCARLLDAGAVDYVARPFSLDELMARIRVALRTSQRQAESVRRSGSVVVGALEIDLSQHRVRESGRRIALSRTEYRLLRALAQHPGMVLSHSQLLERVWGAGYGTETEFLWVYVRRLRRKIEPDPAHPKYILTVPGVGYQLVEIPAEAAEVSPR